MSAHFVGDVDLKVILLANGLKHFQWSLLVTQDCCYCIEMIISLESNVLQRMLFLNEQTGEVSVHCLFEFKIAYMQII